MSEPIDVLLIESQPGDGAVDAQALEAAGNRVHRCRPDSSGRGRSHHDDRFLCTGVTDGDCPLDDGIDVALLVRGRVASRPTADEAGASCALRAGLPLVVHGPDLLDPYEPWLTVRVDGDVVAGCEAAIDAGFEPLREEIRIRIARTLADAEIEPDDIAVGLEFRSPALRVHLRGPEVSPSIQQALGVHVLDAVRASSRTFGQVHVSYGPTPS